MNLETGTEIIGHRPSPHIEAMLAEYGCRLYRFNCDEYYALAEHQILGDDRVELLGGTLYSLFSGTPYKFTSEQLSRMLDLEFFVDNRVELIEGDIVEMAAQKNLHAIGVSNVEDAMRRIFVGSYWIRVQSTLDLSPISNPDPDIAVVSSSYRTPTSGNPKDAFLVVEVSETTLRYDRTLKADIYAAAGITDYWVLNLVDQDLEIFREPITDSSSTTGHRYSKTDLFEPSDFVTTLTFPNDLIAVADLLP